MATTGRPIDRYITITEGAGISESAIGWQTVEREHWLLNALCQQDTSISISKDTVHQTVRFVYGGR
jgi:hypothetical protein